MISVVECQMYCCGIALKDRRQLLGLANRPGNLTGSPTQLSVDKAHVAYFDQDRMIGTQRSVLVISRSRQS